MSEHKNTDLHLVKSKVHRRRFLTTALAGTAATAAPPLQVLKSSRLRNVPPQSELPPELVQQALDQLLQSELVEFTGTLEIARTLWRRFPELVEAPEFPEHLREAYRRTNDVEPSDDCQIFGEPYITDELRDRERPNAEDIARSWAARGIEPRSAS